VTAMVFMDYWQIELIIFIQICMDFFILMWIKSHMKIHKGDLTWQRNIIVVDVIH
jgi:hypothetical protein